MKDNALISIVVPIYNVEKYLDECITSIINQTYKNIEIILVDDGSCDNCPKICDYWSDQDIRIKVIHKLNQGLGMARNTGLKNATGKYVVFVDSDDYISPVMVQTLYESMIANDADTVYCGLNRLYSNGTYASVPSIYSGCYFEEKDIVENVLLRMLGYPPKDNNKTPFFMSVWHAMYSMDIIKDKMISFISEREFMSEDLWFHIKYLQHSKKVFISPQCLYFYRVVDDSISLKYDVNRFDRLKSMHLKTIEMLEEIISKSAIEQIEYGWFLNQVGGQIYSIIKNEKTGVYNKIKKILSDDCVQKCIHTYEYKKNPFPKRLFNSLIFHQNTLGIIMLTKIKICIK